MRIGQNRRPGNRRCPWPLSPHPKILSQIPPPSSSSSSSSMARSIAQTLTLTLTFLNRTRPLSRLLPHRTQSNQSSPSPSDLDSSADTSDPLLRKLEDAIHCIIIRRSAPDWLPFLPGSSYWVPPPPSASNRLSQLLRHLASPTSHDDESSLPLTTLRCWPSSSYFIQGGAPHPVDIETASKFDSESESEEG